MDTKHNLIIINPGSTSTKVAHFENLNCVSSRTLPHSSDELGKFGSIIDQYPLRKQAVMDYLSSENILIEEIGAVVGRGGLLRPLKGGTYTVNDPMLHDLKTCRYGKHASNLGAIIAFEIAATIKKPAFIVNPVVVDEMEPLARYSGFPEIPRKSAFHALNQKAVALKAARDLNKKYEDINLIIAHIGGGISVAAHKKGKVIDVNNGLEEGPFSPERAGGVPVLQLVEMCFSGEYSKSDIEKKLVGKGGLVAYLGTSDCVQIEHKILDGDSHSKQVLEAMAYQISKEIASCSAVLFGDVDSIVITGGVSHSRMVTDWITERVKFIAPVRIYPGEDEMAALAEGAYNVLLGKEQALQY
ncbi:MAG: butyrate kinase [Clostridia bacterium]|nr:butyrate kinase [Clostridia bacterium]